MQEELLKRLETCKVQESPKDPRNYPLVAMAPKLNIFPESFEDEYFFKNLDQGNISACVIHTIAGVEMQSVKTHLNQEIEISMGFGYGYRPDDIVTYKDKGAIPSEALKLCTKVGFVLKNDFPTYLEVPELYDSLNPVKDQLIKSIKFKLKAYAELKTMDEVKSALMNPDIGVIVSVPLYDGWTNDLVYNNATLKVPADKNAKHSNHMMILKSYKNGSMPHGGEMTTMNSWGECFPLFHFEDGYPFVEFWAVTGTLEVPKPTPDVPVDETFYNVIVNKLYENVDEATAASNKLAKLKIKSMIDMYKDNFVVLIQGYKTKPEADKKAAALNAKKTGYTFKVLKY